MGKAVFGDLSVHGSGAQDRVGEMRPVRAVGKVLRLEAEARTWAVSCTVKPGHRHMGLEPVVDLKARFRGPDLKRYPALRRGEARRVGERQAIDPRRLQLAAVQDEVVVVPEPTLRSLLLATNR